MSIPFLKPGQSPSPDIPGGPVYPAIATAFIMQAEELMVETKKWGDRLSHLAQVTEEAEKKRDRMCNWVPDLLDQRHNVKVEIWRLEQELKSMKEALTQLKQRKKSWRPLVSVSCQYSSLVSQGHLKVLQVSHAHPKRRKR